MARLKFTILGCGASPGVPRIDGDWGACDPNEPKNERSRCAALFERYGEGTRPTRLLVDTGPDMRRQLLAARVDALDGVVYTHAHADHLHGIDDLRGFWMTARRLVDVYTDDVTQERLDAGFSYCFRTPEGGSYPPILRRHRITPGNGFTVDGPGGPIPVLPFRQAHGDIDSLGLRVAGIGYSCDVSSIPEESIALLRELDLWVVDALRHTPHPSHLSVSEAVDWIERLRPKQALLTHLHSDLDYNALSAVLPDTVAPAYDGLVFETRID